MAKSRSRALIVLPKRKWGLSSLRYVGGVMSSITHRLKRFGSLLGEANLHRGLARFHISVYSEERARQRVRNELSSSSNGRLSTTGQHLQDRKAAVRFSRCRKKGARASESSGDGVDETAAHTASCCDDPARQAT